MVHEEESQRPQFYRLNHENVILKKKDKKKAQNLGFLIFEKQ